MGKSKFHKFLNLVCSFLIFIYANVNNYINKNGTYLIHLFIMLEKLKIKAEERIGRKIANRGDCQLLSNAIFDSTGLDLSYNTIRRLFGIIPQTKPSINTLNTLAVYVGYKNYTQFIQNNELEGKQELSSVIYRFLYYKNNMNISKLIKTLRNKNGLYFVEMVTVLLRELFREKDYSLIDKIFETDELNHRNFTYSELLYIGNCIGLIFRKEGFYSSKLMNNTNFLHCIYLTFVDYSSLNGYYGRCIDYILIQKKINEGVEIEIFSSALLELKNFLNCKKVNWYNQNLAYSEKLNPILCSRIFSLNFLKSDIKNIDELLLTYHKTHSKKLNITDYYYELFVTSILIKNVKIMAFLIKKLDFKIKFYYQKSHLNCYYLMSGFYYKILGLRQKEKYCMDHFDISECRYSYEEFIKVLHLIYSFHKTEVKSEQNVIKREYNEATTKMKYNYFDEAYLENYFEKSE